MIAAVLAFINMIPGIGTIVSSLTTAFFNSKVELAQARIGGDTTIALATVKASVIADQTNVSRLKVIGGSWVLSFLTIGFSMPFMIYIWQCVVYDKVWMHGLTRTDALGADLSSWATTIIGCLFGSGTAITAAHMFFSRNKAGE